MVCSKGDFVIPLVVSPRPHTRKYKSILKKYLKVTYYEAFGPCPWALGKNPPTTACTEKKIPFMYSFSWNCAASNSHIHVSVSDLYRFPGIGPHIFLQQYRQMDRWNTVYKSLTDT